VFNQALLNDVHTHYNDPENAANPGQESELLADFAKYLEATGFNHPATKIYVTMRPFESFPIFLFLLVLAQMPKFLYSTKFGTLTCTDKKEMLDGVPFLMGIITVLKQLHSSYTHTFLAYLGQFVRFQISNQEIHGYKHPELSQMVVNVLIFLEDFCKYGHFSRKVVEGYIPPYIFDQFKHDNVK
jgi:WASH complex subunit strumpellin